MILVSGTSGVVGAPLCERLATEGESFTVVSRPNSMAKLSEPWRAPRLVWDMNHRWPSSEVDHSFDEFIHCAPLWLLAPHIDSLSECGVKRVIAFSSTSIQGKQASSSPKEREIVQLLSNAEHQIKESCERLNIHLTIFRPSLIYGYKRDQNIYRIGQTIRRFKCLPVVGEAVGLRQPVHCDDLVDVCLAALKDLRATESIKPIGINTYNVVGGETLTYYAMVERIFDALEQRVRIVRIPLWLFRACLQLLGLLTGGRYTPDMADRMNQHLVYDDKAARAALNYAPRDFYPKRGSDL